MSAPQLETVYKITRPDLTTFNRYQYTQGKVHTFSGGKELCGPGYSHAYLSPALASLFNPIHADYSPCILWKCQGTIERNDLGIKVGCTSIILQERVEMPEPSCIQRVAFGLVSISTLLGGILSADWQQWCRGWLSGQDRSAYAASRVAVCAAADAARVASYVASRAAVYAASDAVAGAAAFNAAYAAADAAADAAAHAAAAAAYAAAAARAAAYAAADAAADAAAAARVAADDAHVAVNIRSIAEWAISATDPFVYYPSTL